MHVYCTVDCAAQHLSGCAQSIVCIIAKRIPMLSGIKSPLLVAEQNLSEEIDKIEFISEGVQAIKK